NYQFVAQALGVKRKPQLDVIRNGLLKAPYKSVHDKGIALLSKSVSSLTLAQARGDLYRMKYISEINDIEMQFTYIDQDFRYAKVTKDMFDHRYLLTIYEYGFKKATQGQLWVTELP
ncbi:patatin family protein, partial [Vibrio parahaemolyticus]|nr:patatin family protein [Vibrio parahaemolyticus]